MFSCILNEFEALPPGPEIILGDLNGDPDTFEDLQCKLENHQYIDLGSHPVVAGSVGCPTCFPPNGAPSRRDYMFANQDLFGYIRCLEVIEVPAIPTHRLLRLQVRFPNSKETVHQVQRPPSIIACLHDAIRTKLDLSQSTTTNTR